MASVLDCLKRNPVLVGAFLVAAGQAVSDEDPTTWEGLVIVLVGVVVRMFVSPTAEVKDKLENAYNVGRTDATFGPPFDGPPAI